MKSQFSQSIMVVCCLMVCSVGGQWNISVKWHKSGNAAPQTPKNLSEMALGIRFDLDKEYSGPPLPIDLCDESAQVFDQTFTLDEWAQRAVGDKLIFPFAIKFPSTTDPPFDQ
jgi:hypothetical protein